eukprot:3903380-Rhodomonas_salina.2
MSSFLSLLSPLSRLSRRVSELDHGGRGPADAAASGRSVAPLGDAPLRALHPGTVPMAFVPTSRTAVPGCRGTHYPVLTHWTAGPGTSLWQSCL